MSRDYATVKPQFWTGKTGRAIKALGPEYQAVAMYMMTSPHSNMIGLYYLPFAYISADAWGTEETLPRVVQGLVDLGFCRYDYETGWVWVVKMAKHQLGETLRSGDRRRAAVVKAADRAAGSRYHTDFLELYADAYGIPYAPSKPHPAPVDEARMPLQRAGERSRVEHEQEHKQDQDHEQDQDHKHEHERRANRSEVGQRSELLRTGFLERFAKTFPGVSPPSQAQPMSNGPWLELARSMRTEDVSRFLDAAFADDFCRGSGVKLGVLLSERVRLLAHGPKRRAAGGHRDRLPTEAPSYTEDLGEFGDSEGEVPRG